MSAEEGAQVDNPEKGVAPAPAVTTGAAGAPGASAEVADLPAALALLAEKDATIAALRRTVQDYEAFMRILGHDLRNPLSSILTAAELASRKSKDDGVLRALSRIDTSGRRLLRMLEQLLDVTRIRAGGGLPMFFTEADLEWICRQITEETSREASSPKIPVEVFGSAIGFWDTERLNQLALHLVGNAVDHTTSPRDVRIRIDGTLANVVRLTIHNPGVIPPAVLDALFDPLQRRSSASRKARGLGLGLFISREVARAHRGDLRATSSEEDGTRFIVELPRDSRTPPAGP